MAWCITFLFKEFSNWMDTIINEKDITNIMVPKKVVKYDFNEQFQHHIYLTKNRYDNFNKKINELLTNNGKSEKSEINIKVYDSN